MGIPNPDEPSYGISEALRQHAVSARVQDLDHYRIHGGVSVETDYIVEVEGSTYFESFHISKTYSQFRVLASELKQCASPYFIESGDAPLSDSSRQLAQACELCWHLIESQPTEYFGKVSYGYVKSLAKQRQTIVDDVLQLLLLHFPSGAVVNDDEQGLLAQQFANVLQVFFLTDHCDAVCDTAKVNASAAIATSSSNSDPISNVTKPTAGDAVLRTLEKGPRVLGKGLLKVGTGLGARVGAVTTGVGAVVKKMDITGALFCGAPSLSVDTSAATDASREATVVPLSTKFRNSTQAAHLETNNGNGQAMYMEGSRDDGDNMMSPTKSFASVSVSSRPSVITTTSFSRRSIAEHKNLLVPVGVMLLAIYIRYRKATIMFTVDADVALLGLFLSFCVGKMLPRGQPLTESVEPQFNKTRALMKRASVIPGMDSPMKRSSLIRSAALVEMELEEVESLLESPLPMFPQGAKLGSHNNCWSIPEPRTFLVRGPKYLADRKKVESADFLFPTRGIDLFLTDACPENVGSFSCVFGGNLRTVPTFIINFRLPWGVLILYFEIPVKFLPFIQACYEPGYDRSELPDTHNMTPGERSACRFLLGDQEYKNKSLKIVPFVVDGPWIVKNVVGGKPAVIGAKLPVNYVYRPAEGDKALYLEADLDIVASSAARGILSITRSYTEILTIDLGFVVQGNAHDELPEQMLVGCRIHGVDPLTAPQLPLQSSSIVMQDENEQSLSSLHL